MKPTRTIRRLVLPTYCGTMPLSRAEWEAVVSRVYPKTQKGV